MQAFAISTDSGADLWEDYCQEHELTILPLPVNLEGKTYEHMDVDMFYQKMREGAMPTTSAANPEDNVKLFRSVLSTGQDLLHIAFSSALSSSCSAAFQAAEQVRGEFPERKLIVVDSLCASLGQGLLVHNAVKRRDRGMSIEDTARDLESIKHNICHDFTVDDLYHLHRGGRVSKTVAVVGSLINIKPMLRMDEEGNLVSVGTARGRKASIQAIVKRMATQLGDFENEEIFICHSACPEDADVLADLIRQQFGFQDIRIGCIGPTIGAHSGIGTLAAFFLGSPR